MAEKSFAEKRFIPESYPATLTVEQKTRAFNILYPWLEKSAQEFQGAETFTVRHLQEIQKLLGVSITGLARVLDSHRTGVSHYLVGKNITSATPVALRLRKLVRLGLFCGYYAKNPDSVTIDLARAEYNDLRRNTQPELLFRSSARMRYQGHPLTEYREDANRILKQLWYRESEWQEASDKGQDFPSDKPVIIRSPVYPSASESQLPALYAALPKGLGARLIRGVDFSDYKVSESGGDNTGVVFTDCIFANLTFSGDYSGAVFLRCVFRNCEFFGREVRLEDARFVSCSGQVSFRHDDQTEAWMARVQFTDTRFDVEHCSLNMPGAVLINSMLCAMPDAEGYPAMAIGVTHSTSEEAKFGLLEFYPVARQMAAPAEVRIAAFAGVRLIASFIDLPAVFYGDALKSALAQEDYAAWVAQIPECPAGFEVNTRTGLTEARGLMGDALYNKYFAAPVLQAEVVMNNTDEEEQ